MGLVASPVGGVIRSNDANVKLVVGLTALPAGELIQPGKRRWFRCDRLMAVACRRVKALRPNGSPVLIASRNGSD